MVFNIANYEAVYHQILSVIPGEFQVFFFFLAADRYMVYEYFESKKTKGAHTACSTNIFFFSNYICKHHTEMKLLFLGYKILRSLKNGRTLI